MNNKMDQFEIICPIGEGSFGKVYKAKNKSNGDIVALKRIIKRGRSAKELVNFQRECEIQQHLIHANIIRMLDSFDTPSEMVVVTEFAHRDLHNILAKEGSLGEQKSQELSWDLVSALYYLHSHRILHRDLKPQNILQYLDGKFKLCDFGLARTMTTGTHVLTSIKGTPLYMAPELMSEQPYDHQADLWSLGCIIYEALVGEPPFSTTSILHLIQLIRHEYIRWPSFISKECISFLQGLLQKDPNERMSWQAILQHTFVQGHILILEEIPESPFTHPLTKSQEVAKELQHSKAIGIKSCLHKVQPNIENNVIPEENDKDLSSTMLENDSTHSSDSVKNAFDALSLRDTLKTDLGTTDIEGSMSEFETNSKPISKIVETVSIKPIVPQYDSGLKSNLIINNMNSNIEELDNISKIPKIPTKNENLASTTSCKILRKSDTKTKKGDLEKRKLSQNLDNFSLKLSQIDPKDTKSDLKTFKQTGTKKKVYETSSSTDMSNKSKISGSKNSLKKNSQNKLKDIKINNQNNIEDDIPSTSKESLISSKIQEESTNVQNPKNEPLDSNSLGAEQPIENEEWLDFIQKTMREVIEGDLDSLKQQSLISIIVSPLRHNGVSGEVAKSIAQLLAMPFVISRDTADIDIILKVYYDVKLVANLVYASVLLSGRKSTKRDQLSSSDISAFENMYLLICNLVHSREHFASQFCDALVVLSAKSLMQEFLKVDAETVNLVSDIVGILCRVLCCMPENAELIESIILDGGLERIMELMNYQNNLLRVRTCNLIRLLGRFCCTSLQSYWCPKIRKKLEALMEEEDVDLSMTAEETIAELKSLPFYES